MSKEIRVQEISLPEQEPFTLLDGRDALGVTVEKTDLWYDEVSDGVNNPPLSFKDMNTGMSGEVFWFYPSTTARWEMAVQSVGYIASHELALESGLWGETAAKIASQPPQTAERLIKEIFDAIKLPENPNQGYAYERLVPEENFYNLNSAPDKINKYNPFEPIESKDDPFAKHHTDDDPFAMFRTDDDPFAMFRTDDDPFAMFRTDDDPSRKLGTDLQGIGLSEDDPFIKKTPNKNYFLPGKQLIDPTDTESWRTDDNLPLPTKTFHFAENPLKDYFNNRKPNPRDGSISDSFSGEEQGPSSETPATDSDK